MHRIALTGLRHTTVDHQCKSLNSMSNGDNNGRAPQIDRGSIASGNNRRDDIPVGCHKTK